MSWSDDRIERLKGLWGKSGQTAQTIADELGVSRSAVLGKVHRLGLEKPAAAPPPPARPLFERVIDLVADDGYSLRAAASHVRLTTGEAINGWRELCRRGGYQYDFDALRGDVVTPDR